MLNATPLALAAEASFPSHKGRGSIWLAPLNTVRDERGHRHEHCQVIRERCRTQQQPSGKCP